MAWQQRASEPIYLAGRQARGLVSLQIKKGKKEDVDAEKRKDAAAAEPAGDQSTPHAAAAMADGPEERKRNPLPDLRSDP